MSRSRALIQYSATRLLLVPVMLWLIASMVFLLLRIAPGDPVDAVLGNRANEIARIALREKLGLNQPLLNQYIQFILDLIHGDLGEALSNQEPVRNIIQKALPATLELGITALFIAAAIGLFVGFSGISKADGKIDLAGRIYGISTYALPPFWAAMLVQLIFAVILGWFPIGGRFPPSLLQPNGTGFLLLDSLLSQNWLALKGSIRHLILPAITLGVLLSGIFSRALRLNLARTLESDYIEAARSRGLKESQVVIRHALPNSLLPVLTIAGITIASLIGGALLIEVTFSWPGIAMRLQEAIAQRDYPVVQGIVVIVSSLIVIISVIVDILVATIDPRIRY